MAPSAGLTLVASTLVLALLASPTAPASATTEDAPLDHPAPAGERASPPPPVYNETLAHRLVQLCGCTYCCLQGCQDWTCRVCGLFPEMESLTEVHATRHDAHGFVGFEHASSTIVGAFTGTDPFSIPDWVDDLDFVKTTYAFDGYGCDGCRVHRGFLEAWLQIREQVLKAVADGRAAYPQSPILLTGHSLGGSHATFAALDVAHALNASVSVLYTFGKPRIGNQAFQEFVDASLAAAGTAHFRVTHHRDPVPHLPPRALAFVHESREVYYPKFAAQDGAYVLCDETEGGREDRRCSGRHVLDVDLVDHVTYLGFPFTLNYIDCAMGRAVGEGEAGRRQRLRGWEQEGKGGDRGVHVDR